MRGSIWAAIAAVAVMAAAPSDDYEYYGAWKLRPRKDPMTDVVRIYATAKASDTDAFLLVCMPSQPGWREVGLVHRPFLGRGMGQFTYRVDDGTAVDIGIILYNETGYVEGEDAKALFAKLPGAKRLRTRAVDKIVGQALGDFDLTGVDQVLARMTDLCDEPAKL